MELKVIVSLTVVLILTLGIIRSSFSIAWDDSDKDYWYDQVG
jgi:hypothetical protein